MMRCRRRRIQPVAGPVRRQFRSADDVREEEPGDELAHGALNTGGHDDVVRLRLLLQHPLQAHAALGAAPIAQVVEVAHVQALPEPLRDAGQAAHGLAL